MSLALHDPKPWQARVLVGRRIVHHEQADAHVKAWERHELQRFQTYLRPLVERTCRHHETTVASVMMSRTFGVTAPRHELFYEIYAQTQLSLPKIGSLFRRHHTTVMDGIRKHALSFGLPMPRGMVR